jgi:hypothetical protein
MLKQILNRIFLIIQDMDWQPVGSRTVKEEDLINLDDGPPQHGQQHARPGPHHSQQLTQPAQQLNLQLAQLQNQVKE